MVKVSRGYCCWCFGECVYTGTDLDMVFVWFHHLKVAMLVWIKPLVHGVVLGCPLLWYSVLGYYGLALGVGVCMHGYLSRLCYHV